MNPKLQKLLQSQSADTDGIYSSRAGFSADQSAEIELRERVAAEHCDNFLDAISRNHSIPVMDYEVDRFLAKLPQGALILDIGGCWGWHWRHLAQKRPDVGVLIIDFVRSNLTHAQNVLGSLVGNQIALMHADATALPFAVDDGFQGFDGIWTVQTLQHVPDFAQAVQEAHRVLRSGGLFVNYSLHITPLHRVIYGLLGKQYHIRGVVMGAFYLARASDTQCAEVSRIFGGARVANRYTECLFHPQFGLGFTGKKDSLLGRIDARLAAAPWFARWVARQRSFEVSKAAR
ncbi:MAG: class I SAM-dependent methyltransferase [Gallionella sp.]|nr:class I SAM-dependent methyltransferase [Gallionella sp.]